jgi:hypothetical protein
MEDYMTKPKIEFKMEDFEVSNNYLPETVKIFHYTYNIIPEDFRDMAGHGKLGEINFHKNTIRYVETGGTETVDTFIHELLHGIWHAMDLDYGLADDVEEHLVLTLATGLTTIMVDNPKLFNSLQKMLEKDR